MEFGTQAIQSLHILQHAGLSNCRFVKQHADSGYKKVFQKPKHPAAAETQQ